MMVQISESINTLSVTVPVFSGKLTKVRKSRIVRFIQCFDLFGKEVTKEITPPKTLAKFKAERARKAAEAVNFKYEGDLIIPKEYRELVAKALKIAQLALEENRQPSWIINMAQGKNKAKQIGWLLRNVVEAK